MVFPYVSPPPKGAPNHFDGSMDGEVKLFKLGGSQTPPRCRISFKSKREGSSDRLLFDSTLSIKIDAFSFAAINQKVPTILLLTCVPSQGPSPPGIRLPPGFSSSPHLGTWHLASLWVPQPFDPILGQGSS